MFGELAMFGGEHALGHRRDAEDTSAVALLAADIRRMLLAHPEIAVKMLDGLADRLRAANERISRQSFQTVAGRVAGALLCQVQARAGRGRRRSRRS